MTQIRKEPCSACPYRRDVPSGVWDVDEYLKLLRYEGETWEQPPQAFFCHATDEFLCHGWAVVGGVHLLGLRIDASESGEVFEIPEARIPLFDSHAEAAAHGVRDILDPSPDARATVQRLVRKYPRIASGP